MRTWGFCIVGLAIVAGILTLPRFVNAPVYIHELVERLLPQEPITLGFAGDMMFDRYIRQKAEGIGYDALLAPLSPLLSTHDVVIANLEGSITVFDSISAGSRPADQNNYTFTFSQHVAPALKHSGINIVSLGNNHSMNFGTEGLSQTKQFLTDSGVAYFGEPFATSTYIETIRGTAIGFIAFNEFLPPTSDETISTITALTHDTDFIVVFSHWGYEYEKEPNEFQKDLAHTFIDAGADIVIGAHPHVIQTHETYKGKDIYYSLGNFVFDQYWNEDVRCGLFVTLTLNTKDFSYTTAETTVYLEKDGTTVQKKCN